MEHFNRIAILDMNAGEPNEGMRCLKTLAGEFLAKEDVKGNYDIFEVRINGEIPKLEDYDIFLSSGGPGSPFLTGAVWEQKFFRLLDEILVYNLNFEIKKHVFLVCHSFQLACLHWDLAKVTKRRSPSFGILPIHLTEAGENEPVFEGLEDPFYAVDSRSYQVVLPKKKKLQSLDGKILCREKIRPHVPLERAVMGIRFTNEIIGTQFHPEADAEGMLRYFQREDKRKHIMKNFGEEKYLDMLHSLNDDDKILRTNSIIIPTFLKIASNSLVPKTLTVA